MIRRPPRSTQSRSLAASDVYKRQGAIYSSKCNYLAAWLHPKQLKSLYSAPIIIPSTHVAAFKRWAREGGEWEGRKEGIEQDKRGGGRGKKGTRRVGEERRREREQGKWGKLRSHSSFQKSAPTGPAGHQGPADDHGHALCLRYVIVAPQHIPLECSIC